MMKLLLVLMAIGAAHANQCDSESILCIGTLNNETGVDGSGCLATDSCRIALTLAYDMENDKFGVKVDSRPGSLWSLVAFVQDEKIKRYFHFKPKNQIEERRTDVLPVGDLGIDLDKPFSIRISAWLPASARIGSKTVMVEDIVVSFAGSEAYVEEVMKRKKRQQDVVAEEVIEYEDVPADEVVVGGPQSDPISAVNPLPGETVVEDSDGRVILLDDPNVAPGDTVVVVPPKPEVDQETKDAAAAAAAAVDRKEANGSLAVLPSLATLILSFVVLLL